MAFWSGDKLATVGLAKQIVDPFVVPDLDRVDCSALVLTLGHECFVTPQMGDVAHAKQMLDPVTSVNVRGQVRRQSGGEVIIPSGQFAFLVTEEFVDMPDETMGFISLRSKQKWKGLINVSGFHVDPGFKGRLVYSVYNAGPSNIHLFRGQPMFLLWIADLDSTATNAFAKHMPVPQTGISADLISEVDRPLHSLGSLSERLDVLQREVSLMIRVLAALAVILGLALAAWALLPSGADKADVRSDAVDVL